MAQALAARPERPATRAQPRRTGSLADAAYDALKRAIIRCEIPPGARVTEASLVKQLKLGKTPVREALTRLIHEDLVRNIPRHGYEVAPITIKDVQELYGLRLILEPAAAQLAAGHVDAKHLRRLDELCKAGYDIADPATIDQFLKANYELHATVARASGNPRLARDVELMLEEQERLFRLGLRLRNRSNEMTHEHRDLVTALAAGDGDAARKVVVSQILASERMVVDALLTSPAVLSAPVAMPESALQPLRPAVRSMRPAAKRPAR